MKNKILLSILSLFIGSIVFGGAVAWALPGTFIQGGNSFAETATLGTTDNFDLRIITNNTERARITNGGAASFAGTLSVTGATTLSGGLTLTCTGCMTNTNLATALSGKTYDGLTISTTTGTLTLANGSTLATSGTNAITLTSSGATNITLPTSGTLSTLAGTETLTNKTLTTPTIGSFTNANHSHENSAGGGTLSILNATTGTMTVGRGGTGVTTFTDGGVLVGNGASAVQVTSAGTAGQVLTSNGAGNDPTFQAAIGDIVRKGAKWETDFGAPTGFFGKSVSGTGAAVNYGAVETDGFTITSGISGTGQAYLYHQPFGATGVRAGAAAGKVIVTMTLRADDFGATGVQDGYVGAANNNAPMSGGAYNFTTTEHIGFKINSSGASTGTLVGTQGTSSAETDTSTLTTLANGDFLFLVIEIDYTNSKTVFYYSKNGAALSAGTELSTNFTTNTLRWLTWGVGTGGATSAMTIHGYSTSVERISG